MINKINKERRRSMNATPTWPSNKNQWQGAQADPKQNKKCCYFTFGVILCLHWMPPFLVYVFSSYFKQFTMIYCKPDFLFLVTLTLPFGTQSNPIWDIHKLLLYREFHSDISFQTKLLTGNPFSIFRSSDLDRRDPKAIPSYVYT
jgi:hypothetical protein